MPTDSLEVNSDRTHIHSRDRFAKYFVHLLIFVMLHFVSRVGGGAPVLLVA